MLEEKNEDFDQKRFLIAMVLSGLILVGWQTFFVPDVPDVAETGSTENTENIQKGESAKNAERPKGKEADSQKTDPKKGDPQIAETTPPPNVAIAKFPKSSHELIANGVTLSLSSIDASVLEAHIHNPEQYKKAGNLLEGISEDSKIKTFSIAFENGTVTVPAQTSWEFLEKDSTKVEGGYSTVAYRIATKSAVIVKTFKVSENPYLVDVDIQITNQSESAIQDQMAFFVVGFNDPDADRSMLDFRPDLIEGLCKSKDDLERALPDSLEEPMKLEGPAIWGGVNRRYVALLAVPEKGAETCKISIEDKKLVVSKMTSKKLDIAPKQTRNFSYMTFVGPKIYEDLGALGFGLEQTVDFGILTFICRPLHWGLIMSHKATGNWGWAIVLLTILIRLALWPVNKKVYANSEGMKEIQPQLAALKEKHKNDQKRLSEETMKLFRENGVSMLGCAPMLLQMPILFAFYWTILYSAELYHADFIFWYVDLSAPDPYYILPVLQGVTMFLQQQMMPTPAAPDGANANMMKIMMKIMPITMTVFMLFLPSGLTLYYFLSLLIGVIQQYLIKRSFANKRAAKTT